mmetsp:Transcript_12785/g.32344  ORF Transcript_12785/g.32344 Transcript_12785/m.32344 type:complete len:312 (-) Transcript_12785:316-1251(-)
MVLLGFVGGGTAIASHSGLGSSGRGQGWHVFKHHSVIPGWRGVLTGSLSYCLFASYRTPVTFPGHWSPFLLICFLHWPHLGPGPHHFPFGTTAAFLYRILLLSLQYLHDLPPPFSREPIEEIAPILFSFFLIHLLRRILFCLVILVGGSLVLPKESIVTITRISSTVRTTCRIDSADTQVNRFHRSTGCLLVHLLELLHKSGREAFAPTRFAAPACEFFQTFVVGLPPVLVEVFDERSQACFNQRLRHVDHRLLRPRALCLAIRPGQKHLRPQVLAGLQATVDKGVLLPEGADDLMRIAEAELAGIPQNNQ